MNIKDVVGNIVMVEFSGEGYWSSNSASQVAFFSKKDYEDYISDLAESYTPYFHELDGKHSEVVGKCRIVYIDSVGDLKDAIKSYCDSDDNWMIWESMLDGFESDEEIQRMIDHDLQLTKCMGQSVVTTYEFNGDVL